MAGDARNSASASRFTDQSTEHPRRRPRGGSHVVGTATTDVGGCAYLSQRQRPHRREPRRNHADPHERQQPDLRQNRPGGRRWSGVHATAHQIEPLDPRQGIPQRRLRGDRTRQRLRLRRRHPGPPLAPRVHQPGARGDRRVERRRTVVRHRPGDRDHGDSGHRPRIKDALRGHEDQDHQRRGDRFRPAAPCPRPGDRGREVRGADQHPGDGPRQRRRKHQRASRFRSPQGEPAFRADALERRGLRRVRLVWRQYAVSRLGPRL